MKTIKLIYLACMLIFMSGISLETNARRVKNAPNPFPITVKERDSLLKAAQSRVVSISSKYATKNIDEWNVQDREDFLKAKAMKMMLIIAPDFYRKYNSDSPTIVREISREEEVRKGVAFYRLKFKFDPSKEKLLTYDNQMVDISVWANDGSYKGIFMYVYNLGMDPMKPEKEDEMYNNYWKSKKRPDGHFHYRTGYERLKNKK